MVPAAPDGLREAVVDPHRRYSRRINARNGWRGHLWQGRFFSFLMDTVHLHHTVRYLERNPVAADLCELPQQWPWPSARAYLRGRNDDVVDVGPMLEQVDDWAAFVSMRVNDDMRTLIARRRRTGRPLGNDQFVAGIERTLGRRLWRLPVGRQPKKPAE